MPGRGRGMRGSSRGRGRGGRGRGRGRRGGGSQASIDNRTEKQEKVEDLDINKDIKGFFMAQASFEQHFDAQQQNRNRYASAIAVLQQNGVEISANARARALAAAWARGDKYLVAALLTNKADFGLIEVLKALKLLDSSRRIRQEEKKVKRLQQSGAKVKPDVLGRFKSTIDSLTAIKPKVGSASGAICKGIRCWVKGFTKKELEYFALHYPTEPWRKLADICHFNPKKDFPALDWFLPFCYGTPAPEGTLVYHCKNLSAENVNDLLKEYPIPYSHVKEHNLFLTNQSKARIAGSETLDTVIWYYEDLRCDMVDKVILSRFEAGEQITLNDGKLLERMLTLKLLRQDRPTCSSYSWKSQTESETIKEDPTMVPFFNYFIPVSQARLKNMSLPLEPPIAVIGDRSGSMEVAIRTSTIIAALLSAIVKAKLVFFNLENMDIENMPTSIDDVRRVVMLKIGENPWILEMAVSVSARGGTPPAVSLWPFYERKERINTFILVTDEEENNKCKGYNFSQLYDKYYKEVFPAKLVFVSFLRSQDSVGFMVSQLKAVGYDPLQFKFDGRRPDLSKLDKLFGLLSTETEDFEVLLQEMECKVEEDGIARVFEQLKVEGK